MLGGESETERLALESFTLCIGNELPAASFWFLMPEVESVNTAMVSQQSMVEIQLMHLPMGQLKV